MDAIPIIKANTTAKSALTGLQGMARVSDP
jgi:hypothetical protein